MFDDLFGGGGEQAADDIQAGAQQAQSTLQQQEQRGLGFLQPFQQGGVSALGNLQSLLGTPSTQTVNQILGQFQQSPAFKFRQQQAQQALQNQLQAQGLGGSGIAGQRAAQLSSNLAGQGQEQFLQDVLGQRRMRQQGLESLFSGGLTAAGGQAQLTGQFGQAEARAQQQAAEAQAAAAESHAGGLSNLLGSGLGLGFNILSGGLGRALGFPKTSFLGGGLGTLFGGSGGSGGAAGAIGRSFGTPGGVGPEIEPGSF